MALSSEAVSLVHSGVAATVATRDEDLRPTAARGWGPEVSADGQSVTLLVNAPPGSQTRANLEGNGAIAVCFGLPTLARGVQVKGVVEAVREPTPAQLERAEGHLALFCAEALELGMPERLSSRIFTQHSDLVSVSFPIQEAYDQTPGPSAGRRL